MRYTTAINDYRTDAAMLMVFLGKPEWRTKYLKNHLLPFQHCLLDTGRAGIALIFWHRVKRLEGTVLLSPKVPLLWAATLRIGVEIAKYGGASESRFCHLNNVERVAWTGRWNVCARLLILWCFCREFCRAPSQLPFLQNSFRSGCNISLAFLFL